MKSTLILLAHITIFGGMNLFLFSIIGKLFSKVEDKVWTQLLLGYALTSIIFNVWIKLLGYQGQMTIIWVYLLGLLIGIVSNLKRIKNCNHNYIKTGLIAIGILTVLVFYPSHLNYQGNSASSNYWHTANSDTFDGLCGAQSILLEDSKASKESTYLGTAETRVNSLELLPFLTLDSRSLCSSNQMDYLVAKESMQYTNLTLFSEILHLPVSMYIFLFQSLLNLLLFFNMLVIFGKRFLSFDKVTSRIFAGVSVFSHLYFVTFINGHIGSMMAQAPLVLLITLITRGWGEIKRHLPVIAILTIFIGLSYPYILPFVVIYFLIVNTAITGRYPHGFRNLMFPLVVISFAITCWFVFESARYKAEWDIRSWGTFLNPLGPLQYFGLLPGNINGIGLLGLCQQWLIQFGITSAFEFSLISICLTVFILINVLIVSFNSKGVYPNKLLFSAMIFPVIIGLTSRDPYYTYKVSYIFQFVVVGYLVVRIRELSQNQNTKSSITNRTLKLAIQIPIYVLLIFNFIWNGVTSYQVIVNNTHWASISRSIGEISTDNLSNSVLQTDSYVVNNISSYLVQRLRPRTPESLVIPLNELSIEPKGSSFIATVNEVPDDSFLLDGDGLSSSESDSRGKFRWVYGIGTDPNSISPNDKSVKILRLNSTKISAEKTLCVSLPDWDLKKSGVLRVINEEKEILAEFRFSKSITCKSFYIPKSANILTLQTNILGSAPSLFDTRAILYRIWDLGSNQQIYKTLG